MSTRYKKNFLTDIVYRIDFAKVLVLDKESPVEFQKQIADIFPLLEPVKQMGFLIENDGVELRSKEDIRTLWSFRNSENNKLVEIDSEHMALSFKSYLDFEEFSKTIESVNKALFSAYPNIHILRLGLRYINQITLDEKDIYDWGKYLSNSLLTGLGVVEDKSKIRRSMHSTEIFYEPDIMLNFRYGIFNKSYPAQLLEKEFILDYDCSTKSSLKQEELPARIDKFHDIISENFESQITEEFKELLKK